MENTMEDIAGFYSNRTIFVTGGTGFLGKVLLEKLLRSCPDIQRIFVLLRPKKGCNVDSRLKHLIHSQVFDRLRSEYPQNLSKLTPIYGDLMMPGLGISSDDLSLLIETVSVVFHAAATVRFDQPLSQAVRMNVIGTHFLVNLSKQFKHLAAIVHVSTAYCNCDRQEIKEELYPPPADPQKIIQMIDCLDEETLQEITPRIIGNRPNTYTFTKALAEHLFVNEASDLPAAIVRPSIVTAALREPFAGWIDNMNGPSGMIVGAGKGVLHTLLGDERLIADLVPVDMVVNLLIAVAWRTAHQSYWNGVRHEKEANDNIVIYNSTSSGVELRSTLHWGDIRKMSLKLLRQRPYLDVLWYPSGRLRTNRWTHTMLHYLYHQLPACLLDCIFVLLRKPPRMVKMQKKIRHMAQVLEFFTTHEWHFTSNNVGQLYKSLSSHDKQTFHFDFQLIDWSKYFESYVEGVRTFLLKEKTDLSRAKAHLQRMHIVHRLVQMTSLICFIGILFQLLPNSLTKTFYLCSSFILRYFALL